MNTFQFAGRDIQYRFTPAQVPDAPLLVILHGHTKTPTASKYASPDMNVLCPVDNFGHNGWGSWFLGEFGDHFWLKAMPALIRHVYKGQKLLFAGSSMGGYGAILHGVRNKAIGVYANIPQTRLLGSTYSDSGMKQFFEPIFKPNSKSQFNDLRKILSPDIPTSFIITGLRWDKKNYIDEQTLPFLAQLSRFDINFHSEILFGKGHTLTYTIAQSVDLLRKNMDVMVENYNQKTGQPPASVSAPQKQSENSDKATLPEQMLSQVLSKYLPKATDAVRKAAQAIIARDSISVHSYNAVPISDRFWHSGDHSGRSWRFSLYSFAPLDALMACGEWTETARLVQEWADEFGAPEQKDLGDFPWHDHATALRLDRLSTLRLAGNITDFTDLAKRHADVLMQEAFYSKHTNHGYDQALALLLASHAFKAETDTKPWAEIGLARLIDELEFAFTPEGVHVENSPAYHVGMTANLVRARLVKALVGLETDFDFDKLLNNALLFTAWITGPDRRLAMLGDSTERGGVPPVELANLPNYENVVYTSSGGRMGTAPEGVAKLFDKAGYAIYRSDWVDWSNHVYLVMKSGYLSRYHRQDDDLNILLQGYGEHWLIDSGLYNHNQQDPVRVYMRSELAHNVVHIADCPISRAIPAKDKAPTLTFETTEGGHHVFKGTTHSYKDTVVSRVVTIENKDQFQIADTVRSRRKNADVYFQFHVPADKKVRLSSHMARISGRTKDLIIRAASGEVGDIRVFSGMEGDFKSVYSPKHNVVVPSQVIVFGPLKGDRIRFSVNFQDR